MGLLDILNGMQNGPRGVSPSAPAGSGGMSPVTMALMGLLAYKAIKHLSANQSSPASQPGASPSPSGGGLGGLLSGGLGGLGGLLAGGAAGSVLSGGLGDVLKQFQQSGQGEVAQTWVNNGPNQQISPSDLSKALGEDQINTLAAHSGMTREELLAAISQHLPELINQLTPNGRVPTEAEASKLL
jgi:uncharacterized protein YidB (DUF937 family)